MVAHLSPRNGSPTTVVPRKRSSVGFPEAVDPRDNRVRLLIALAVAAVGLFVSVAAFSDSLDNGNRIELPRLEVPSVRDLTLDAATATLEERGFAVSVEYQPNEVKAKGQIIGQTPLAGAKAEQGELITLLASDGPLGLLVPSVLGQQAADAKASLEAAGFVVELVQFPDEVVRPGEVLGTSPSEGTRSVKQALVKLIISAGPAPRNVPAVVNVPVEVALAEIGRSGLGVGRITKVFRADLPPGTVFESTPAPGTPVPRDTPVSLKVSGPKPTNPAPYLVGLLQKSAEQVANEAGFNLKIVASPVVPGDALAGRVISQGTPPQAMLDEGTVIEVTVATETVPAAPVTTAPVTTAAPGR